MIWRFGKYLLGWLFFLTGVDRIYYRVLCRYAREPFVLALLYHGISEDGQSHPGVHRKKIICSHIEQMKKRFDILSEDDLIGFLDGKVERKTPGFLVTFDDGYANDEDILHWCIDKGIFPTIFLTVNYIGTPNTLPINALNVLMVSGAYPPETLRSRMLILAAEKGLPRKDILALEEGKDLSAWFKYLPAGYADLLHEGLTDLLMGAGKSCSTYRMLDWEKVVELGAKGVRLGSHGKTHHILSRLPEESLEAEAAESRKCIEERTGAPCRSFAFPNGKAGDFNERAVQVISKSYEIAFLAVRGVIRQDSKRHELKRLGPEDNRWEILADAFLQSLRNR